MYVEYDAGAVIVLVDFVCADVAVFVYVSLFAQEPLQGILVPGLIGAKHDNAQLGEAMNKIADNLLTSRRVVKYSDK